MKLMQLYPLSSILKLKIDLFYSEELSGKETAHL